MVEEFLRGSVIRTSALVGPCPSFRAHLSSFHVLYGSIAVVFVSTSCCYHVRGVM